MYLPDSNVLRHDGKALGSRHVFFTEPPEEIGQLISAQSDLSAKDNRNYSIGQRLFNCLIQGVWSAGLIAALIFVVGEPFDSAPAIALLTTIPLFLMARAYFKTLLSGCCTYVGELGVSRHHIFGRTDSPVRSSILQFKDAERMTFSESRKGQRGSTLSEWLWQYPQEKENGGKIEGFYRILAYPRSREEEPRATLDDYFFGVQAEKAWKAFEEKRQAMAG